MIQERHKMKKPATEKTGPRIKKIKDKANKKVVAIHLEWINPTLDENNMVLDNKSLFHKKTGWVEDGLKGEVKEIVRRDYDIVTGFTIEDSGKILTNTSITKYDAKGFKIEMDKYNSDGDLTTKTIFNYDEKGNMIEEASCEAANLEAFSIGLYSSYLYRNLFTYNDKGHLIKDESRDDCEELATYYKYDDNGTLLESACYRIHYAYLTFSRTDNLEYKTIYKYDDKGNQIEWAEYKADGALRAKHTFSYDENGNKVESSDYNESGAFGKKHIYKYDVKGNRSEDSTYNKNAVLTRIIISTYTYY